MKRFIKFILSPAFTVLLFILIVTPVALFAQDSTGGGSTAGFQLPSWATTAGLIILALYEVVIRFFPTAKSYSLLGFIITVIQKIIPNRSTTGEKLP